MCLVTLQIDHHKETAPGAGQGPPGVARSASGVARRLTGVSQLIRQTVEIFKTRLDKVLCSLLWLTLLRQEGWTR